MTLEKFHYETDDGKKLVWPKFDQIPFGVIRKLRREDDAEQFFGLIEEVSTEKELKIIDAMTQQQVTDLMTEWQKDAGIDQGES